MMLRLNDYTIKYFDKEGNVRYMDVTAKNMSDAVAVWDEARRTNIIENQWRWISISRTC